MIIYIMHSNCLYTYNLPIHGNGNYIIFDYDSNFNKRSLVNVETVDNKAYMFSNNRVKIFLNNQECQKVELVSGNFYILKLINGAQVILYASLLYDNTFVRKVIADNSSIVIGNKPENDIVYYAIDDRVQISYNGKFHIKSLDNKTPIFINKNRKDDVDLNNFDRVFINGLKIVVCKNSLFINNINSRVTINSQYLTSDVMDNLLVENVENDFNNFNDFYDDNNYFFKSPVFQHKTDKVQIDVTDPPAKEDRDDESVFMTTVPTFIMSMASVVTTISSIRQYRSGETDFEQLLTELLMSGSFLIGGIVWPFVEKWARNIKVRLKNHRRNKKYITYLNNKEKFLEQAVNEQRISLTMNNPVISECQEIIEKRKPELFSRNIENNDFLNLRLGTGKVKLDCELNYKKQEYILEKDPLIDRLENIIDKYEYVDNSPYLLSLKNSRICAFIIEKPLFIDYINYILLQILTYHSYLDLKIVVLTSKATELDYLKYTNHCWDAERNVRYFATSVTEAQTISSILERELNQRKAKEQKEYLPYYLIISDCIEVYRNLNIIDDIIDADAKYNFGLAMFSDKISSIPSKCNNFVNISKKDGAYFQTDMSTNNIGHFTPEFINNYNLNINYCVHLISNIPLKNNANMSMALPDNYDFLQMYNIGNVEQLNVDLKWNNSNLYNSLAVPLGIDVNGNIVNLDLHERNHGPHGLIAGMTGSGKSELIITYILSLAVNYRPDEVQFVLIDYKGGGLAGAFENRKTGLKLPHLVGTITNLDKAEMKRTLVSIKSELQRRQRLFNEAKENLDSGNIDIYKYQKLYREGKLEQTLSHLFIICDEFAELKAQQPDFMDELVSAARIGRSLGIHLILATQKPSGIVDDQIWSNSKFKISCKVQTEEDSNEVIKKPDAAFLKESGRFYLQVGYDEYFVEGQSAYTGNNYTPSETYSAKIDNSVSFINDIGEIVKSVSKKEEQKTTKSNLGDELTNILKYIINVAKKIGFENQQLWLDNVPQIIYQNSLVQKYKFTSRPYLINPVVGEFDDPKNQRQGPVIMDVTNGGNFVITGATGSGKATLLSTFIYANIINHNCDELNIYIVDCGAEKLNLFQNAPQVGDVLTIADTEKIKNLFYMINSEMVNRQKHYSKNGNNFIGEVNQGKASFPNIVVIINDLEVFKEGYEEIYDDQFAPMTRNCSKYGIYFIVTTTSTNSLGFVAENNFPQKIMLNMVDQGDFVMYFDNPPIPNKNPGRGVVALEEAYEFQTALVFKEEEYSKNMMYVFAQLNKFLKNPVKPVPVIPKSVTFEMIQNYIKNLDSVPLGIDEKSAQVAFYNFSKFMNVMSSENAKLLMKFIPNLVKILSLCDNTKIILLNTYTKEKYSNIDNVKEYNSGFKNVISSLYNSLTNVHDSNILVIVLGYSKLQNHLKTAKEDDDSVVTLDELITSSSGNQSFKYLLYEKDENFDEIKQSKIYDYIDGNSGLWLGSNFDTQDAFEQDGSDDYSPNNGDITVLEDGKITFIKFVK